MTIILNVKISFFIPKSKQINRLLKYFLLFESLKNDVNKNRRVVSYRLLMKKKFLFIFIFKKIEFVYKNVNK